MKKNLAIITLNYNGTDDTIECIHSLDDSQTTYKYDIYIFDNASNLEEVKKIRSFIGKRDDFFIASYDEFIKEKKDGNYLVTSTENYGFAGGNNKVIDVIKEFYDYVLLLNNDTVVTTDFIDVMLNYLYKDTNTKFASCRINNYYDKELLWNCGGRLKLWGLNKYFSVEELDKMPELIKAPFITGCALFIDTLLIEKHGGLTEDFFFGEEDFNFCWRMKCLGIKGICINKPLVYHKVSKTSQKSGVIPGRTAAHYVNRIVDMRQFYPYIIWLIWREVLIFALGIKCRLSHIDKADVSKMKYIMRKFSNNNRVSKEDTFRIWKLEV